MTMRLDRKWSVSDRGAEYEFRVKLSMRMRGVKISDEELQWETEHAVDVFADLLRKEYKWAGTVGLTGRSGGWLSIEDKAGGATDGDLEEINDRVDQARKDFETAIIESFGYEENGGHRHNPEMTEREQAAEFGRRRNMVGTTVRQMPAGNTFTVALNNRGTDIGDRVDVMKRGKVVSQSYFLPKLPDFLKNARDTDRGTETNTFNGDVDQWFDKVADAVLAGRNADTIRELAGIANLEPTPKNLKLFLLTVPHVSRREIPWASDLRLMITGALTPPHYHYAREFKTQADAIREFFSLFRQAAAYKTNGHRRNGEAKLVASFQVTLNPGKGRGSLRTGRTGLLARIMTDDDGESFFVIVDKTAAGRIVETGEVSTNFSDAGEAEAWAKDALRARGWVPTPRASARP